MRAIKSLSFCVLTAFAQFLSSCVHEFPEISQNITVDLTIRHELDWTEYNYLIGNRSRSGAATHRARYIIYAYPAGKTDSPAHTFRFYNDDASLQDFTTTITLPPGKWDLHAWQDHEPREGGCYYNTEDLSSITYTQPYRGDIEQREAFEGMTSVEIPETYEEGISVSGTIDMARPMGRYVFIATDFEKFYTETLSKPGIQHAPPWHELAPDARAEALKGYAIVALYPFYMPSTYNYFTQRITDSSTGIHYDAEIVPISSTEAKTASDHVFMNHHESGVQVQLGLRTPSNKILQLTDVITVPMKRGQTTYVRGNFLTAGVGSGLDIDFMFSGDINIKI